MFIGKTEISTYQSVEVAGMQYYNSILDTIGNTPLVRLNRLNEGMQGTILSKVEYFNPGQSVKDRIAIKMIEDAEKEGKIKPGGTIIEGTSGNTGLGLALAAVVKGYKCIFTTTDKQSMEKVNILRAIGAEVKICPTNVEPDDPRSYYSVAKRLNREIPNSWYPNQYNNLSNRQAHYETTGPELWEQTDGKITHFVVGMGTGGTMAGAGRYLKEKNPDIQIIGIDSIGSVFKHYFETGEYSTEVIEPYLTEGIGEDIIPENMDFELLDEVIQVSDKDAFLTTRKLARREGLFVGGSCGAAVWGALEYMKQNPLKEDDVMVILLPDSGTRYISKIYNDEWMRRNDYLDSGNSIEAHDIVEQKKSHDQALVYVAPDTTLSQAIQIMRKWNISQIPVLDGNEVVGSLDENQILSRLLDDQNSANQTTAEIMEEPFPVIEANMRVDEITRLLDSQSNAVLVRSEDGSLGILTRSDLISAISKI